MVFMQIKTIAGLLERSEFVGAGLVIGKMCAETTVGKLWSLVVHHPCAHAVP